MLSCIVAARSGDMSLVEAADSLLLLRDSLEEAEPSWLNELTALIATLESAGMTSPEQLRVMGARYDRLVEDTLSALEQLVCEARGK
jgi:hypothetical protein